MWVSARALAMECKVSERTIRAHVNQMEQDGYMVRSKIGRPIRKIRIESICLIGVLICAIMILGSAGAYECETITFFEFVWQLLTSLIGGLGLCMVIWCEETKAARKAKVIHRTWWTW